MPNWVSNTVTVRGPEPLLADFAARVAGTTDAGDHSPFTFQRILPRPGEEDADWYVWNTANWGTKWDACHAELVDGTVDGERTYQFSTAWSYPEPVFVRLVELFPELTFRFAFEEEQGWGGSFESAAGRIELVDSYDVPDSHAEMAGRHGSCYCAADDPVFPDCFTHAARLSGVTDEAELEAIEKLAETWELGFQDLLDAAHAVCRPAIDGAAARPATPRRSHYEF